MGSENKFRLTYATMFDPPEELHKNYEAAVAQVKTSMGGDYAMWINGRDVFSKEKSENRSPIDTSMLLGTFQRATTEEAHQALESADRASHDWGHTSWSERIRLVRKAADLIDERIFSFGAVLSLEAGKTRMEALADAAEAADLMRYACDQMETNDGFVFEMGQDPLKGFNATNVSKLKPFGVWVVISPFNFPAALTAGPIGAAIVAGNTVVYKPAEDTPWTSRLLAEAFRDAGLPDGVVNYVTGKGSVVGKSLVEDPITDGITFTGSVDVGMGIYRSIANGNYPRPTILEMGGKNPAIISRNADLDRAVQGLYRSAFGNQGQKCSAASRIYVEEPVYDDLVNKLIETTRSLKVGDPTRKEIFQGPVINRAAYENFKNFTEELSQVGEFVVGGKVLTSGEHSKGFFCEPTIATNVPTSHRLWKHEMFVPITMLHKIKNLEEGMALANDVDFGLTAGFYGNQKESRWFFDNIEAGVTYANRPQGATTGAWPGFQPFGGWKGSGSTGKNAGGHHYLQLYMREQVNTLID